MIWPSLSAGSWGPCGLSTPKRFHNFCYHSSRKSNGFMRLLFTINEGEPQLGIQLCHSDMCRITLISYRHGYQTLHSPKCAYWLPISRNGSSLTGYIGTGMKLLHIGNMTMSLYMSIYMREFPICDISTHLCPNVHVAVSCVVVSLSPPPSSAAYMRQWIGRALYQIMACRLFGANFLSKSMLRNFQLDTYEKIFS